MASQSDYANLVLALGLLGQSAVAAYPESGPYQMAEQSQAIARATLAEEARKKAVKKAGKKQKRAAIGNLVGTVAGSAFGPAGAAVGGQLGGMAAGGSGTGIDPSAFAGKNALQFNAFSNPFKRSPSSTMDPYDPNNLYPPIF